MAIDLLSIPQLGRNLNRVIEIARILAKYGFADQLHRVDRQITHRWLKNSSIEKLSDLTHDARIRLALTELGTTFIKLGQMLSTRRDLVGASLADELAQLQTGVSADPYETTRTTIETELRKPLDSLFREFSPTPLASASIGQVHRATLPDGSEVAVKVQHPDIEQRIRNDLSILRELARLAEDYLAELRPYRPVALVSEFERTLLQELDFRRELRFLQLFNRNFANDEHVRFPIPIPELSTSRVLVMSFLSGTSVQQHATANGDNLAAKELAQRWAKVFLDMIFRDGFYHADPHPGNLLILPGGKLGILDGGMVGRVDPVLRSQIEAAMTAALSNDATTLADLVMQMGEIPPGFEPAELEAELAEKISFYWGMPLDQFQLSVVVDEFTEAIRRYRITLRSPIAMLLKVLVMLEGTTRLIDPRFNVVEVLESNRGTFVARRFSRRQLTRDLLTAAKDWEEVIRNFPRLVREMMSVVRKKQFAIQLDHHHLEPSVNRLAFSLMVSSLFVGSALLWANSVPPAISGVSVFGFAGCCLSVILGYRLFRAIQKSGHLDGE